MDDAKFVELVHKFLSEQPSIENLIEVIREYRDDGGSEEVAADAEAELYSLLVIKSLAMKNKTGEQK